MEKSYINEEDQSTWFGNHYILDLWGIKPAEQEVHVVERYLQQAAINAGATILHSYIHDFGNGGVSGVVLLKESHISIHTWPERAFAAIDIYLCGDCEPLIAVEYLIKSFCAEKYEFFTLKRGISQKTLDESSNLT